MVSISVSLLESEIYFTTEALHEAPVPQLSLYMWYIDVCTCPLLQGECNPEGICLAKSKLGNHFNPSPGRRPLQGRSCHEGVCQGGQLQYNLGNCPCS